METTREQIARVIFEETRRQYVAQNNLVQVDGMPMRYITWDQCEQEPWLLDGRCGDGAAGVSAPIGGRLMVALAANEITIEQRLYPQQFAFLHDQRRYPAFIGGRNSGKTFTGAYKAFERMSRGGLGIVAGPSFPAMKLGPKPQLLKALGAAGMYYVENKNDNTLYVPSLHAGVQFAGLENDTYTRGPNYAWGWIDELDYVDNPEMYKTAKAAVREGTDYQLFSTSTPKGQYIIWREWVQDADDFHRLYKASTYDNIFINAADYVAGVNYQGISYDQEINAEFVKLEGLVYPGFDRMRQVQHVDCEDWATALGVDIGSNNPTVILTLRYAGDRFHLEREIYQRDLDAEQIVSILVDEQQRLHADFIVVDPSGAAFNKAWERRGLNIRLGKNQIAPGIVQVSSMLPNLTVDPSCIDTIAEFESYQYPMSGKVDRDVPIKANDHAMDALRYLAMELIVPQPAFFSVK
jgi:phage terminase large subunit